MNDFYERIHAVTGDQLQAKRIMLLSPGYCAIIAELLAACGVMRWTLPEVTFPVTSNDLLARYYSHEYIGTPAGTALRHWLEQHHPANQNWEWSYERSGVQPDLLIGAITDLPQLCDYAVRYKVPALAGGLVSGAICKSAIVYIPANGATTPELAHIGQAEQSHHALHDRLELSALTAMIAKALLLADTAYARPDITQMLHGQDTIVARGSTRWPWQIAYLPLTNYTDYTQFLTDNRHQLDETDEAEGVTIPIATVMVVGCGSLGSQIARGLAASGYIDKLVLIDGERVKQPNPVRQFYHPAQIGEAKVRALQQNITGLDPTLQTETFREVVETTTTGLRSWSKLIRRINPDLVILATGTDIEYALAGGLRRMRVRHIATRCYPRARYWEAIVVDNRQGPCLACTRGQLYTGDPPALTAEEQAAYTRLPYDGMQELAGDPATLVETGLAAGGVVRLALGLLARPRPGWLAECLKHESTCFLGSSYAERLAQGNWAYGISIPGQVAAYGSEHLLATGFTCPLCGRKVEQGLAIADSTINPTVQIVQQVLRLDPSHIEGEPVGEHELDDYQRA